MSRRPINCVLSALAMVLLMAGAAMPVGAFPAGSPVDVNGRLSVCGTKLCNEHGHPIQLRGMSTHGLQWYSSCLSGKSFNTLADHWGADIIRLSMYVQEGGYVSDPVKFTRIVNRLIAKASRRGLYVIIDWHMLNPGDPFVNLDRAKTFFKAMAARHADRPNVFYEVANEPHGVSWARLKSYHEQIVALIRKKDRDAVILLGTRGWSSLGVSEGSNEREIVRAPVMAKNVMYTFHFYAASHGTEYFEALSRASQDLPVFVTEFGTQSASGDGANDFERSKAYLKLMKKRKISWVNWNFSDDHRSGAVLQPGTCESGKYKAAGSLKSAGIWVRAKMRTKDRFPKK